MIESISQFPWMTAIVLGGFLLDWAAILFDWHCLKPLTKVLAMSLVILWTLIAAGWDLYLPITILLLAQVLGLGGDIFLLFSGRWFLWGLASFLVGHLYYLILLGIQIVKSLPSMEMTASLVIGIIVILVVWLLYMVTFFSLMKPISRRKALWVAIQIYAWILSGLTAAGFFFAFLQPAKGWQYWLVPLGGTLFMISDSILAYNRFIRPIRLGQLWVRISYHLAQLSLAVGFLLMIRN
jgi:uncharacterized membrane protein YhhN